MRSRPSLCLHREGRMMNKTVSNITTRISEDAEITIEIEELCYHNYETNGDDPQDKYLVKVDLSKFDNKKFFNFMIDFPNGEYIEVTPGSLSYNDKDIRLYQEFGGR